MRCLACDVLLTDYESTRKYGVGHELEGGFVDLCSVCFVSVNDIEPLHTDMVVDSTVYNEGEIEN
jgi:hypothetical protein